MTDEKHMIELSESDFGALAVCSVRYSVRRKTYMPSLVTDIIAQHISEMSDNDLSVIKRDIENADSYGDTLIDKPVWEKFLVLVEKEQKEREK